MNSDKTFIAKCIGTYAVFFGLTVMIFIVVIPVVWLLTKFQSNSGVVQIEYDLLAISLFGLPLVTTLILAIFDTIESVLRHDHER